MNLWKLGIVLILTSSVFAEKTIKIAADGSGDFKTIQEAIAAVPDNSAQRTILKIAPGVYRGPIIVGKSKVKITFLGEDPGTTRITYDKNVYEHIPEGSDKFNPSVQIIGDDFRAENLTIENTSGDHGQALAMRVDGDREVFINCRLLGWQDTLMVNNARHYFGKCYIEGRVDFIYGSGISVFEDCTIHSKNGGHVTAASTPQENPFGFVFLNCKLTGDDKPWDPATTNPATTQQARKPNKMATLGRPWRPYAAVAYINCEMGDHVIPEGWNNWRKEENEKTARYSEYKSTGPGGDPSKRHAWSKQLTDEEAAKYTIPTILGGKDNWDPKAH